MALPTLSVHIAFTSEPDAPAPAWVDVTAYVLSDRDVTITRGRQDEFDEPAPGRLSLTLDNADGRFTYGLDASPYYPNVVPFRRIRVTNGSSVRFDGYVTQWPVEWESGNPAYATVQVQAIDRLARLSRLRALRPPVLEFLGAGAAADGWELGSATLSVLGTTTVLSDGPSVLYGLQESSGSSTAGDSTGINGRPTLTLSTVGTGGGTVEFGTAGLFPEGTGVLFTPESSGNGQVLTAASLPTYLGGSFTFFAAFAGFTGSTGAEIAQLGDEVGETPRVGLSVTPTNVTATVVGSGGASVTVNRSGDFDDNAVHGVVVTVTPSTVTVYVDQLATATGSTPASMGTATGIRIGSTSDPVQVAWVGLVPRALSATEAQELTGYMTGEPARSDVWVGRWLSWLGIASSDYTLDTGLSDIAYQQHDGRSVLELVAAVNRVEGGVLVARGDGTYEFHSRDRRYNRAASLTLSVDGDEVPADVQFTVDTSRLVNTLRASRPAGATYTVADSASVARYGTFSAAETFYTASDTDLYDVASWRVYRFGDVEPRTPSLTVDLLTLPGLESSTLATDIGDRVTVADLPSNGPASSVDLFVEGVEERYSNREYAVVFNTSPGSIYSQVWTLDSVSTSQLGTTTVVAY